MDSLLVFEFWIDIIFCDTIEFRMFESDTNVYAYGTALDTKSHLPTGQVGSD